MKLKNPGEKSTSNLNNNAYNPALSGQGGNPSDAITIEGSEIPKIDGGFTPVKPGTSNEKSRTAPQYGARSTDFTKAQRLRSKPDSNFQYGSISIKNK